MFCGEISKILVVGKKCFIWSYDSSAYFFLSILMVNFRGFNMLKVIKVNLY